MAGWLAQACLVLLEVEALPRPWVPLCQLRRRRLGMLWGAGLVLPPVPLVPEPWVTGMAVAPGR